MCIFLFGASFVCRHCVAVLGLSDKIPKPHVYFVIAWKTCSYIFLYFYTHTANESIYI